TRYTSFHSQTTTHSAISPLSLHDALPICDKTNCNVDNLEWVTSSENQIHATMNGLQRPQSKLTADDVREIRKLSAKGYSQRKLANMFDVGKNAIQSILEGRTWTHVV